LRNNDTHEMIGSNETQNPPLPLPSS